MSDRRWWNFWLTYDERRRARRMGLSLLVPGLLAGWLAVGTPPWDWGSRVRTACGPISRALWGRVYAGELDKIARCNGLPDRRSLERSSALRLPDDAAERGWYGYTLRCSVSAVCLVNTILVCACAVIVRTATLIRRPRLRDGHTHCGKCGYILKNLSEPRCTECGTWL